MIEIDITTIGMILDHLISLYIIIASVVVVGLSSMNLLAITYIDSRGIIPNDILVIVVHYIRYMYD